MTPKLKTWKERMDKSALYNYDNYAGPDMGDVYEFMYRNRDSNCREESNFEIAFKTLEEVWAKLQLTDQDVPYEIVKFGDFAYGWFEVIHIDVNAPKEIIEAAEYILECLEDYPILNEMDCSLREHEAIQKFWDDMCHEERCYYCNKADIPKTAARRKVFPIEITDYIEV